MNTSVYHFETPRGVVRVGEGRGFVMEISSHLHGETLARRIVVTAACCLPYLPPSNPWSYKEKTFNNLLSLLGETVPSTSAECLFYDPITDITVLGEPDREKYAYEWKHFQKLMQGVKALPIGETPVKGKRGWLLSLGGTWRPCKVEPFVRGLAQQNLYITDAEGGIFREMSGSPILLDDGKAIGVLSTTLGGRQEDICEHSIESHPQPILTQSLPIWILDGIRSHNGQDVSSI